MFDIQFPAEGWGISRMTSALHSNNGPEIDWDRDSGKIPMFPLFKNLELSDYKNVLALTKGFPPYSDFDFGSMYAWNFTESMLISNLNGNLVVRFADYVSGDFFFTFIGTNRPNETAETLLKHSVESGARPELKLVPASVASKLNTSTFSVNDDPDNTDYILSVGKLATYDGPELAAKRRHVSQFLRSAAEYRLETLDLNSEPTVAEMDRLYRIWQSQKAESGAPENEHEYVAMKRCIEASETLGLLAVGLFVEKSLAAFWILGILEDGYSISHFEKADTASHQGIFAFFKKQVAQLLAEMGTTQVNLEQDLGIPGLRRSKKSYAPQKLLRKFVVSLL